MNTTHFKPVISGWEQQIEERAERIKKAMHDYAQKTRAVNSDLTYQQAQIDFLVLKLAEQEYINTISNQ